jgi:hypothetical protein
MTERAAGRLIVFPEICPLASAPEGVAHYLSWPSWEFFVYPPDAARNPGASSLFSSLRDRGLSRPLLIPDPPNFLPSLAALRGAGSPETMRALLDGPPLDPSGEGNLKRQILAGGPEAPAGPDRGYLTLALFTLAELEEGEIDLLFLKAMRKNRDMLSTLMGPPDDQDDDGGDGGFGEDDPGEDPEAEPAPGPSPRALPEKHALALQRTWLRLAAPALIPGDRLWAAREEFRELLAKSFPLAPNSEGEFVYIASEPPAAKP